MSESSWVAIGTVVITIFGGWLTGVLDFKKLVKKTEIENKDDVYNGWKSLCEEQRQEKEDLKREYKETRQQLEELQKEFLEFKAEMDDLKYSFKEKEDGYLIQISKLEDEVEELKEENEVLKEENKLLKEGRD